VKAAAHENALFKLRGWHRPEGGRRSCRLPSGSGCAGIRKRWLADDHLTAIYLSYGPARELFLRALAPARGIRRRPRRYGPEYRVATPARVDSRPAGCPLRRFRGTTGETHGCGSDLECVMRS
jgi:hypothetical protein